MLQISSILLCIVGLSVCSALADKPKFTLSLDKVKVGQNFTATCAVSVPNAPNANYYVAFQQNGYNFFQFKMIGKGISKMNDYMFMLSLCVITVNQSVQWFHYTPLNYYGLEKIDSHSTVYPNFAIEGMALNKNVSGRYTCTLLTKPFMEDVYSNPQTLSLGNAPNTGTEPSLTFANFLIVPIALLSVEYSFV